MPKTLPAATMAASLALNVGVKVNLIPTGQVTIIMTSLKALLKPHNALHIPQSSSYFKLEKEGKIFVRITHSHRDLCL